MDKRGSPQPPRTKRTDRMTAVAIKQFMQSDKIQKYKMAIQTNT